MFKLENTVLPLKFYFHHMENVLLEKLCLLACVAT